MPGFVGWSDFEMGGARLAATVLIDLDRRHPGDLDPGLIAKAATLAADALRAQEEPGGERM